MSPQLIVAEYSLVVAIRFGSVKAPMGAVNAWPSISVSVAGAIGATTGVVPVMVKVVTAVADEPPTSLMNTLTGYDPCCEGVRTGHGEHAGDRPRNDAIDGDAVAPVDRGGKIGERAPWIGVRECGDGAAEGGDTRDDLSLREAPAEWESRWR